MRFYDVLARNKVEFKPRDPGRAGIYVCGVTVYDRCHIGHLRSMLSFDAIIRYLEHKGLDVTYVRNFTDVDDKIIQRAREIQEGWDGAWRSDSRYASFTEEDWEKRRRDDEEIRRRMEASPDKHPALVVSEYFIERFYEDFEDFGMRKPDVEPRVSEHIDDIISMISDILGNGYAYDADGDVYFDVPSYHQSTRSYGKLSGRNYEELEEGARVNPGENKRHGVDFALWKAAKEGEPAWDSPWGQGRPGWHIECSVMSSKYLGGGFDIHGGGKDLIFPHHENEIAQYEAARGHAFCNHWMHNGFVTVNGVKMSKSLGNFISIDDARRLALPEVWRYLIVSVHYASPIDFSTTTVDEETGETRRGTVDIAAERVHYFYSTLKRVGDILEGHEISSGGDVLRPDFTGHLLERFDAAMDDDFNTPKALAEMGEVAKYMNELAAMRKKDIRKAGQDVWLRTLHTLRTELLEAAGVLGLFREDPAAFLDKMRAFELDRRGIGRQWIEDKIAERARAKKEKDFAAADAIRDELLGKGIELRDMPGGVTEWDVRF